MGDSAQPPPSSESDLLHSQEDSSGWGGWGNWGTSAISVISGIQKAAASAADEITKNAIAAAKDAAKGVAELQENVSSSLNLQAEKDTEEASTVEQAVNVVEPVSPQDKLRSAALQKLEGASQDTALSHGLKVIDVSVENLASGAWQAFGTAWRGSKTFIQKLENSAENLADSIQKQGSFNYKAGTFAPTSLIEGGKAITARGLEVLEYVGKEAIDLIATEAGIELEEEPKQGDGDIIEDNEHFVDDVTFDRCFYIYGGPEQLEELEALSNHHMLLCNRAKAKLPSEQKSSFDSTLKQLQQVMDLGINAADQGTEVDKGKRVETGSIGDVSELKQIRETGVTKAAEMAAGFTVALGGLAMAEAVQKTTDRLEAIRVEGVHRLSELCASGILQLLNLGKSVLLSSVEQGESMEDNVVWPSDCLEKAKLIRAQAQAMVGDVEAISLSFITGIGDVTAAFQAAIRSEAAKEVDRDDAKHELMRERSIEEKAQALSSDLESDGSAAIEKVQSGLRHLVYVVLFTSLKS
eukprot:c17361_g1_i1 orf=522-2093(+)